MIVLVMVLNENFLKAYQKNIVDVDKEVNYGGSDN